jgi:hypothetical protein
MSGSERAEESANVVECGLGERRACTQPGNAALQESYKHRIERLVRNASHQGPDLQTRALYIVCFGERADQRLSRCFRQMSNHRRRRDPLWRSERGQLRKAAQGAIPLLGILGSQRFEDLRHRCADYGTHGLQLESTCHSVRQHASALYFRALAVALRGGSVDLQRDRCRRRAGRPCAKRAQQARARAHPARHPGAERTPIHCAHHVLPHFSPRGGILA